MAEEKKGITVKIDADLHAEVKAYVESQGLTMAEFVSKALDDELHAKIIMNGGNTMEKMRTMAFQVPEDLFQKIKDYLNRNHMTQKDFVIGLITREIDRDLSARQEAAERAVTADEQDSEEYGEQDDDELSEGSTRTKMRTRSTMMMTKMRTTMTKKMKMPNSMRTKNTMKARTKIPMKKQTRTKIPPRRKNP